MSEPSPGLDLVKELHELVKTIRYEKSLAEVFGPIIPPLAAALEKVSRPEEP